MCSSGNVPSVSSINRILRNRAAERAALEYTKIASRSLFHIYPQYWNVQTSPQDSGCAIQDADSSAGGEEADGKVGSVSDDENELINGEAWTRTNYQRKLYFV